MKIEDYEIKYAAMNSIDIGFSYFKHFRKTINFNKKAALELLLKSYKEDIFTSQNRYDEFINDCSEKLKPFCGKEYGIAIFVVSLFIKHIAFYLSSEEREIIYAPFSRLELLEIDTGYKGITHIKSFNDYMSVVNTLRTKMANRAFENESLNNAKTIYEWEILWWNNYWDNHRN